MTDEYIRKADAIGAIWHSIDGELFGELESCAHAVIGDADNAIEALKPADVVPVVHAHWKDNKNGTVSCSRCSTWFQKERVPYLRFCGYCGARMDGKGEE